MAYDNTNRGSIWKNKKKEKDTHPDFTGTLNVDGVEYWVSAWKRGADASNEAPALTFSVKPKEQKAQAGSLPIDNGGTGQWPPQRTALKPRGDMDDEIPF